MAGAKAETGVGPVFLHHMPDELDAVGAAPVTQLTGKARGEQAADLIHVVIPHIRGNVPRLIPQAGEETGKIPAANLSKTFLQLAAVGDRHARLPQAAGIAANIAEARLIGEKACDNLAKGLRKAGVMRFIDQFLIPGDGLRINGVDMAAGVLLQSVRGESQYVNPPFAAGQIPIEPAGDNLVGEIPQGVGAQRVAAADPLRRQNPVERLPLLQKVFHQKRGAVPGTGGVDMVLAPIGFQAFRVAVQLYAGYS